MWKFRKYDNLYLGVPDKSFKTYEDLMNYIRKEYSFVIDAGFEFVVENWDKPNEIKFLSGCDFADCNFKYIRCKGTSLVIGYIGEIK